MIQNIETITPEHRIPVETGPMSEQAMRDDLNKTFADLKRRAGALQSNRILDKNKMNKLKINIINQIFAAMKEVGVDPGNLDSVSAFLQQLEAQDPDLLTLFESAMNGFIEQQPEAARTIPKIPIAPGPAVSEKPVAGGGPGLMGKYSNLQQTMLRR